MHAKPSNIDSQYESDEDQKPLIGNESPSVGRINSVDDRERETEPLLDINKVEPVSTSYLPCTNIPSRYVLAIWAFFGFFALYSMRVNLSVAIVAMVKRLFAKFELL